MKTNIIANFSNSIGNIRSEFYGANTHVNLQPNTSVDTTGDGNFDSIIDYEWHRTQWLNANMDNQRGDMYLSDFYDGQGNRGFNIWKNSSDCEIINNVGCDNQVYDWIMGAGSGIANGTINRSSDSHSGLYSINVTSINSTIFPYTDILLEENKLYNVSVWTKSDDIVTIGFQNLSDFVFCNGKAQSIGSGNWEYLSITCTPTSNQTFRIPMEVNNKESALFDDFNLTKDGESANWWQITGTNLSGQSDLVKWANDNNQKILYITIGIPSFLQERNEGLCFREFDGTTSGSCKPDYNYTDWYEILDDFINQVTNNREYINSIEIEIHNEPYLSNWNGFLSDNNITKATEYVIHYNNTYNHLKEVFPSLAIGGPSGNMVSGKNMIQTFLSNMTTNMDFCTIHPYASSGSSNRYYKTDLMINRINNLINNATLYGANCSRIILSEWNNVDASLKNDSTQEDEFGIEIAYVYQSILNNYPENITSQIYQWSEQHRYNSTIYYPEYPQLWSMVTEPQLKVSTQPTFKASYNVTKDFATYHSGGSTVYVSSSNSSNIKTVTTKKGNDYYITAINTGTEPEELVLDVSNGNYPYELIKNAKTGQTFNVSSGTISLGVLDSYNILYLQAVIPPIEGLDEVCSESYSSLSGAIQLGGVILTIILVSAVLVALLLSIGGYLNIEQLDFREFTMDKVLDGVLIVGFLFLVIVTMVVLLAGSFC